jgi:prefoldin subunit 5
MDAHAYKRWFRNATATGVAVCLLTFGASAFASSQKQLNPQRILVEQPGWADSINAQYAIDDGRSLVTHLQNARSLLNVENISDTRKELTRSTEIAKSIEHLVPYMVVEEKINSAIKNLTNGKLKRYNNNVQSVYANLDNLAVFAPAAANTVRAKMQKSEQHARSGAADLAVLDLKEVRDSVFNGTPYIPVFYVDSQLQAANKALQKRDPDVTTARREINNALDSLVTDVDENSYVSPQS